MRIVGQKRVLSFLLVTVSFGNAIALFAFSDDNGKSEPPAKRVAVKVDAPAPLTERERWLLDRVEELEKRVAAIEQCLGIAPSERQCLVETPQGFTVLLEVMQRQRAVVDRLGEIRLDRQRLIVALERFLETTERVKDHAEIRQRPRIIGLHLQRGADQLQCIEVPALMMANDSKQMPCIEVIGSQREDPHIQLFGARQVASLMQGHGLIEALIEVQSFLHGHYSDGISHRLPECSFDQKERW